jgi:hypothetical protein
MAGSSADRLGLRWADLTVPTKVVSTEQATADCLAGLSVRC